MFLLGFFLTTLFNNYAPDWFGHETLLYTAFKNAEGVYKTPFLVTMGWAFVFTVLAMVLISLTGPVINPQAFQVDTATFKLVPSAVVMIAIIMLVLSALYVRFW